PAPHPESLPRLHKQKSFRACRGPDVPRSTSQTPRNPSTFHLRPAIPPSPRGLLPISSSRLRHRALRLLQSCSIVQCASHSRPESSTTPAASSFPASATESSSNEICLRRGTQFSTS